MWLHLSQLIQAPCHYVLNREKGWVHKGACMCRWQKATRIYRKGGYSFTDCHVGIHIHNCHNRCKKEQDIGIMDLPVAFLHAENDKAVVMFMKGKMAELMVHVAPQIYCKYIITTQWVKKILYMRVQKALYCMLKSVLLLYQKL